MIGTELLVDTNILIYLLQGNDEVEEILQGMHLYVSFITELELYGLANVPPDYEHQIESLLNDCLILPMNNKILQQYKTLRKTHKLKLADTVIAATALVYDIPFVTADKQFGTIKNLKLIQYEK